MLSETWSFCDLRPPHDRIDHWLRVLRCNSSQRIQQIVELGVNFRSHDSTQRGITILALLLRACKLEGRTVCAYKNATYQRLLHEEFYLILGSGSKTNKNGMQSILRRRSRIQDHLIFRIQNRWRVASRLIHAEFIRHSGNRRGCGLSRNSTTKRERMIAAIVREMEDRTGLRVLRTCRCVSLTFRASRHSPCMPGLSGSRSWRTRVSKRRRIGWTSIDRRPSKRWRRCIVGQGRCRPVKWVPESRIRLTIKCGNWGSFRRFRRAALECVSKRSKGRFLRE